MTEKLRVLFLDIDGVLNSRRFASENPGAFNRTEGHLNMLDASACARMQRVLSLAKAKVVISSSWRLLHSVDDIRGWLAKKGLRAEILGATTHGLSMPYTRGVRGSEIQAWLDEHPEVDSFAIVDDDNDMYGLEDRFVQTTWARGFCDDHVAPLLRILLRPKQFIGGQAVNVYGVQLPVNFMFADKFVLDLSVEKDTYEAGIVIDPCLKMRASDLHPTGALVSIRKGEVIVRAPYTSLSNPWPRGEEG